VALGGTRVMLAPSPDDVEYALADWPAGDRAEVTDLLADAGILDRWNEGPARVLAVAAAVGDAVDRLLDRFAVARVPDDATSDADETAGSDSELVQATMADLVAADRLQHEPATGSSSSMWARRGRP
jgi:CelD/BcsL family acetyltransferase involved in cellulose biosynthesis